MFHTGDRVIYGIHGVCRIVGVETQLIDKKERTFFVLEPYDQSGSRYMVPVHSQTAMSKLKRMLSPEELESMIRSDGVRSGAWIPDEARRKQIYRELITCGDREKLMTMVHTLYRYREEQAAAGRKMHMCDDNFLRDAEKLLTGEAAVVLELDYDQAKQYIRRNLQ